MPCTDGGPSYPRPNDGLKRRLDKATRLLCTLCAKLDAAQLLSKYATRELVAWWQLHKSADQKRRELELADRDRKILRQRALKKARAALTTEERYALGIHD